MNYRNLLSRLYFFALKRRYRVSITGEELLQNSGAKLILPNHQSHIDPQLMAVITNQHCEFVPVVSEKFIRTPVIGFFLRAWGAIGVVDSLKAKRNPENIRQIFPKVKNALIDGKSVIIYPSGQITHRPIETILNKRGAYTIVSTLPKNVRVIGVRISGLWGSMWSVAWNGQRPRFILTFIKGILLFPANLFFFIPKRRVSIEFVDITEEAILNTRKDRHYFNTYMEKFFNIQGPEKATYIKHLFFLPRSKRRYPENLSKH